MVVARQHRHAVEGDLTPTGTGATRKPPALVNSAASDPGLEAIVEPRVRRRVADRLGVSPGELSVETSLADDLAVDSLDLLETVIAVEEDLDVSIAERHLESVRTYGDLVALVVAIVAESRRLASEAVPTVAARVVAPEGGTLERTALLTPYAAETLVEDALFAGPGASLEIMVLAPASSGALNGVRRLFARLGQRGIRVQVSLGPPARLASR